MQKTIFFDIDRTLVENHGIQMIFGELIEELANKTAQNSKNLLRALWDENDNRQKSDPDHILTMDWNDMVQKLALQYGVALSQTVDVLWKTRLRTEHIEVLDNAPQILQQLKVLGYQLVIATKGLSKYQVPVLELSGLLPYFDDILAPDITGYLKTSPGFYQTYPDSIGLRIQVGDRYLDDVICPQRVGLKTILRAPIADLHHRTAFERRNLLTPYLEQIGGYPAEGSTVLPDAVIVSLSEIPAVLPEL